MEYSTIEARLATFEPPSKRSKLGWPHKAPTPTALAKAGFYYKPSSASNDNAICYLCDRALDGWEKDDDPVHEHLKHAGDCGWAILMNAAQEGMSDITTMEDPTSQLYTDARMATFQVGWPHEGKRGWTCKTEKMVEAGWYYAPTADSDDFVSCVHCKLSLDGWEPKDNPFDEHYRRSPDCAFFHFAGTTAPSKRPKAKKGRASKASRTSKVSTRLSTQSNATFLSETEAPSVHEIPDLDESIDTSTTSVMSTMSTTSTAANKGKRKGGAAKAKTTKSKRAKTTKSTKSKKDDAVVDAEAEAEPPNQIIPPAASTPEREPALSPTRHPVVESTDAGEQVTLASPQASPKDVVYPTISHSPVASLPQRSPAPVLHPSPTPVRTKSAAATPKAAPKTATFKSPTPVPASPSVASDAENAPPSTLPKSSRPPPPATSTPPGFIPTWNPTDVELVFNSTTPGPVDLWALSAGNVSDKERQMTVQEWIEHIAGNAESSLRAEGERVVSVFEQEGQRAMGVLENIVCVS